MKSNVSTKTIGLFSAIGLGVSSIIGSGWLFAPYKSAVVAGPAAILSWVIGGIIICLLGLCFCEIATLYPKRGLSAIIPVLSHNKYFAFPFAIANWLGIVAVIGLEADATIQYLINLFPSIQPLLYTNNQLTIPGDTLSVILVLGYSMVNYWGASTLVKTNNVFAVIKVLIPIVVTVVILATVFHPQNFTQTFSSLDKESFMPYGMKSIFSAMLTTGIIVAFNGFQTIISFCSEVKKPNRTIPLSVVIAILFCTLIYIFLQIAFIGAIPSNLLQNGWSQLQFSAPIVQLLGLMGLGILSTVIYFGATISPSGTAIAYTGSASRMFTAMARNEQMPKYFGFLNDVYRVPRRSLVLNTILAILFLVLFRSWSSLAQVLSILHVISYLPIPIAIWVFRERISRDKYPFRIPLGKTISLLIFIFFTYLFTLADLKIATEVMIFFAFFMLVFIFINTRSVGDFLTILNQIWPMAFYFVCLLLLVVVSPDHSSLLSEKQFLAVVTLASVISFIFLTTAKKDAVTAVESDPAVNMYIQTTAHE